MCIPDDEDLNRFRKLVDTTDGWTVRYNKNNIKVWVQNISEKEAASTRIRMLKVRYQLLLEYFFFFFFFIFFFLYGQV